MLTGSGTSETPKKGSETGKEFEMKTVCDAFD